MALKTNYQNAILNTSLNAKTKYQMTNNADGTVSFTDVSAYTQTGDSFGANDMNSTNQEINTLEQVDTVTLSASGWTGTAPYTQAVTLSRITSASQPVISMGVPSTVNATNYKNMKKAYGYIDRVVSGSGKLTFYCYNKKPTVEIKALVKGV